MGITLKFSFLNLKSNVLMKKAKVMLTAVGLLAVVGGALAFKAHRVTGSYFCSTTSTTSVCNLRATTDLSGGPITQLYCTTLSGNVCSSLITVKETN